MARSAHKGNYELLTARFNKRNEKDEEVVYKKGDVVPLTENEYAAFKDKFGREIKDQGRVSAGTPFKPQGSLPDPKAKAKADVAGGDSGK